MKGKGKISIIGAGLIGQAWAVSFARGGYDVAVWDGEPAVRQGALKLIRHSIAELEKLGILKETAKAVSSRVTVTDKIEESVLDSVYLQECIREDLETKKSVFAVIDDLADPGVVLASSTSALLPSDISKDMKHRERFTVAHPINPPSLIPAVEVVPAPWTANWVVEKCDDIMRKIGQKPILLRKEIDGFVVNRLQGALLEEAFRLVDSGIADPDDIDTAIKNGLALRWSFIGPFETIDLNAPGGVRDYVKRYGPIYEKIHRTLGPRADWYGPVLDRVESARRAALSSNDILKRQQWRDRRLMALARDKQKSDKEFGE